jgi:hypothetical protein
MAVEGEVGLAGSWRSDDDGVRWQPGLMFFLSGMFMFRVVGRVYTMIVFYTNIWCICSDFHPVSD